MATSLRSSPSSTKAHVSSRIATQAAKSAKSAGGIKDMINKLDFLYYGKVNDDVSWPALRAEMVDQLLGGDSQMIGDDNIVRNVKYFEGLLS